MARRRRSGSNSFVYLARQEAFGTPVTTFDAPVTGGSPKAGFIQKQFVFTRNTIDTLAETETGASIVGGTSAAPPTLSRLNGGGELETELLPDTSGHLFVGWCSPDALPTNTALTDVTIAADNITVTGGTATVNADGNGQIVYPGQLEIAMGSGVTGDNEVTIRGFRRGQLSHNVWKIAATETLTLNAETAKTTATSFYEITEIVMPSSITVKPILKIKPDTQYYDIGLNSNGDVNPYTGQFVKGTTAVVAHNQYFNDMGLAIGDTIRATFGVLAWPVYNDVLATNIFEKVAQMDPTIRGQFKREALNQYPSYASALILGDPGETLDSLRAKVDAREAKQATAMTDVSISASHGLEAPPGIDGNIYPGEPIRGGDGVDEITVSGTIFHETDTTDAANNIDWQQRMFDRQRVPIIIRCHNWLDNGRQNMIEFGFSSCLLTVVPNLTVEDRGQMTRTLTFGAFQSEGATTRDELNIRVYSKDGFAEA